MPLEAVQEKIKLLSEQLEISTTHSDIKDTQQIFSFANHLRLSAESLSSAFLTERVLEDDNVPPSTRKAVSKLLVGTSDRLRAIAAEFLINDPISLPQLDGSCLDGYKAIGIWVSNLESRAAECFQTLEIIQRRIDEEED
jgi:hypothetical protein